MSSAPKRERQAVLAPAGSPAAALGTAGLVYVPVEHDANQSRSPEEVEAIATIVAQLTAEGVRYRNVDDEETPLTTADLMIVAPYNAQVTALAERLPGLRIGTVDKFQGQEAPVVIVSLDDFDARGRAARHGFSLQRESAQRRDVTSQGALHPRRQPALVRARLPHAAADAARERVLPLPRARARGSARPRATHYVELPL